MIYDFLTFFTLFYKRTYYYKETSKTKSCSLLEIKARTSLIKWRANVLETFIECGRKHAFVMPVNLEQEANARVFMNLPLPFHKNSDHGATAQNSIE